MRTVGLFEAKNELPQLLDEVARGECVVITRHGKHVARIEPIRQRPRRSMAELRAAFRELRATIEPGGPSIRELIDDGRL